MAKESEGPQENAPAEETTAATTEPSAAEATSTAETESAPSGTAPAETGDAPTEDDGSISALAQRREDAIQSLAAAKVTNTKVKVIKAKPIKKIHPIKRNQLIKKPLNAI